jgi:hypothetical protein
MKKVFGYFAAIAIMLALALVGSAFAQEDCSDHDFYWHNHGGQYGHHCNPQKPIPTVPHALHELTAADYYGPRSAAEKDADRARIARRCAEDTIREDNVPKCTDREFVRFENSYDAHAAAHDNIEFCALYKATNTYGGYMEESSCAPLFSLIWTEVPPSVSPAPPTLTPVEQAKQAQQHADCLKAAVDNPSIVCK